jgi:hypothetical protein
MPCLETVAALLLLLFASVSLTLVHASHACRTSGNFAPPELLRRRSGYHKLGELDLLANRQNAFMLELDVVSQCPSKHFYLVACVWYLFQEEENSHYDESLEGRLKPSSLRNGFSNKQRVKLCRELV